MLAATDRLPDQASTVVTLSQANLLRFNDPVTHWLRSDPWRLDAAQILRESADVYACLDNGMSAWTCGLQSYSISVQACAWLSAGLAGVSPGERTYSDDVPGMSFV